MNNNLYVVTCISNPVRYHSRYALYKDFAKRIENSGAILYTVEMAFGNRPFVITDANNPHHIQFRSSDEIWHKENLLNLGIQRLPADWQYVAWVDADIQFTRPDWVEETIQQLQHYQMVQMFSYATDVSPQHEPMHTHAGFIHNIYHGVMPKNHGQYSEISHPGYAWAARREALDAVGGLIDQAVLGAGDYHMALAMIGQVNMSYHGKVSDQYKEMCQQWQNRCTKHIKKDIGYVAGTINHYWHGTKADRRYQSRWQILVNTQYKPHVDTFFDTQGLLKLNDDNIQLRDDIRKYFRSRFEDSDWTGQPHKMLP